MRIRRYKDEERWRPAGSWRLVYGRRKTGKSFFVREFTEWDRYYFVLGPNEVLDLETKEKITAETFYREFYRALGRETVVVDEFHRLGREFMERLHAEGRKGELTLVTSSLFVVKNIFEPQSPLLGLFDEFPMGLISPSDAIKNLKDGKVDIWVLVRDPWVIEDNISVDNILYKATGRVEGIVAEIFNENERRLTDVYKKILEAVAAGWRTPSKIYYYVKNSGINISSPTVLAKYLTIFKEIGILKGINVWGRRGHVYEHVSPVFDLHYYLKDRYGFPEVDIPMNTVKKVFKEKLPLYVEGFMRSLMEEIFSLPAGTFIKKEREIDIVLGLRRPEIFVEVKWRKLLDRNEIRKVEENMKYVEKVIGRPRKKILIVPDSTDVPDTILEVWDVEKIINIVTGASENPPKG